MYREHFSVERVMAEDPHVPKRNRRTSSHRLPWCYRVCMLLILTLFGLHLLAAGSGAGSGESLSVQRTSSVQTGLVSGYGMPFEVGLGAGAIDGGSTSAKLQRQDVSIPSMPPAGCKMLPSGWHSRLWVRSSP